VHIELNFQTRHDELELPKPAMNRLTVLSMIVAPLATGTLAWSGGAAAQAPGLSPKPAVYAYSLTGRVVHVADGDTFTVLVQGRRERVRMASIDAPETTKGPEQPGQPFAQASRDALAGLVSGKTLELQCFERDRFERNICDVPLGGGTTANRRQVEAGMAWANMEGQGKFMRDPELGPLEARARESRLGLWQRNDAVRPWVWRYQCWKQRQCHG
jgi:endonuclease YncB( thermonuclease family)